MTTAFQSNAFQNNAFQIDAIPSGGAGGLITFLPFRRPSDAEIEKKKLEIQLKKKLVQLAKVEKKIAVVEKKVQSSERPQGILANLHLLQVRANKLEAEIETLEINLQPILDFLAKLDFEDDDDEDLLWLL